MDVLAIQRALKAQNFDPGPLDGIWGRLTMGAVEAFQRARGLNVDGMLTQATSDAILAQAPAQAPSSGLVWLDEAERLRGTKEVAGSGSNPAIVDWAKQLDIDYSGDDVPWCGLFTAHCVGATLPSEPLPNNPLGARNWNKFGSQIQPRLGAVLVFWRGSKDGWQGHVGFYAGEDSDAYHVLGGNQSNKVSIARVGKDRFLGARWPRTVPVTGPGAVAGTAGGGLSTNEH
jgi:uncharacterized protein (TIGR02594 family)